jgi:hypothetical protein
MHSIGALLALCCKQVREELLDLVLPDRNHFDCVAAGDQRLPPLPAAAKCSC